MKFESGRDFEDFVFGRHSDGEEMKTRFFGQQPNFDRDVKYLIKNNPGVKHPDTYVGEDFFRRFDWRLRRKGINTEGLMFLPTIGSMVDLRHYADGLVFLPAVPEFPITIDLFLVDDEVVNRLRREWFEAFRGTYYSFLDFQSDLFRWKTGRAKWVGDVEKAHSVGFELDEPADFRGYTDARRPENHFIWTPQEVTRHGRKLFVQIFTEYLLARVPKQELIWLC